MQLMAQLVGGTVHPGMVDVYTRPVQPRTILFSPAEVEWLIGIKVTVYEVMEALTALGFAVVEVTPTGELYQNGQLQEPLLQVTVPTFRTDIVEGADLVEEVVRMIGYNSIPSTIPVGPLPEPQGVSWFEREYAVRQLLIGAGLTEIVTYAMTSRARMVNLLAHADASSARFLLEGSKGVVATGNGAQMEVATTGKTATAVAPFDVRSIPAVTLVNPLSSDLDAMRLTLMSGLLETVQENSKRNRAGLRFFELGRRYLPSHEVNGLPDERRSVGIALCGPAEISWNADLSRPADFYDLKGVVETLLAGLHITRYRFTPTQHPTFHPGRCALLELLRFSDEGEETFSPVGVLGEVHPLVQQRYDLPYRANLCELDMEQLYAAVPTRLTYMPISRHQELTRDLALVVDEQIPAEDIHATIMESGGELLRSAVLFDVYTGEPIPPGKKNLTYSLTYQAQDRTLTDAEANALQEGIVRTLYEKFGAVLRK